MENNRAMVLLVYLILKKHSNSDRPLNAVQIASYIKEEFQLTAAPDRKTIYSHLKLLKQLSELHLLEGEVVTLEDKGKAAGHYFVPEFTKAEIKLLCDAVASSRFISNKYSKELIQKLGKSYGEDMSRKYDHILAFKYKNYKSYNASFFMNIEQLSEAIELKKKVSLQYLQYDLNKKLVPKADQTEGFYIVSPYYLLWAINHYYLLCHNEDSGERRFLRVDKMTDVQVLYDEAALPLPVGFNIQDYSRNQAFMFGGQAEPIRFRCEMRILGQVVDFFGDDVELKLLDDNYFEARIHTSVDSIKYWILQYITAIDQIQPKRLQSIIQEYLEDALRRNTASSHT